MPGSDSSLDPYLDALAARALDDGGFAPDAERRNPPRPDATAWAILALEAAGVHEGPMASARTWLTARQGRDGRVSLTPDQPAAVWPTSLAILAWQGSATHAEAQQRGVKLLLRLRGLTFPKTELLGHDTTLVGWPWIELTHSWVEPTAFGVMALDVTGNDSHPRAREARELLLDRQLEGGGWNYGNTTAFGQVQRPTPDSTGVALGALASAPAESAEAVEPSLLYLEREVARLRAPLSLAWALLGLSAWIRRPDSATAWCRECLERQSALGDYDTALLAVVLLAAHAPTGLVGCLRGSRTG